MIRLTRRYRFCASHRLHSGALSSEANREVYGKCNNPYGHGHDYLLEITVAGPLHPDTGQVVHVPSLDVLVTNKVLNGMDQRDLNSEVPEFSTLIPTSENIVSVVERRLRGAWKEGLGPEAPRLESVRLHETKRNRFELRP